MQIQKLNNQTVSMTGKKINKTDTTKQGDNKNSNTAKFIIGSLAITATVLGGIYYHKNNKLNTKINEYIKSIEKFIKTNKENNLEKYYDPKILEKHINETKNLSKKERSIKLKEILDIIEDKRDWIFNDDANYINIMDSKEKFNKLPDEIKKLFESKDQYSAKKAYLKYCDEQYVTSKNLGKTIEESIEKVFGKNSGIKPHTYNTSDEAKFIGGYINMGGYKNLFINSENKLLPPINHSGNHVIPPGLISHYGDKKFMDIIDTSCKNDIIVDTIKYKGKKYISIIFKDTNNVSNKIIIATKNGELTPLQKDILNIKEKFTNNDLINFQKLISPGIKDSIEKTGETGLDFMNYDAILSLIQTIAKRG